METYAHLLEGLGQHIGSFLLIDEDDDWRVDAVVQDIQQLLPVCGRDAAESEKPSQK